ncbi:MAG: fumarylacetoacetate hydrolase family protein [Gammaproteobacteria bacterium]|nr:fumarylacetoacetate hydrolase family protein [Gammaproteobacteria bacterium]MCZ6854306.1 fumarylacetoacetate hydrolase family protein [Gammaproteobacteria bacterium]
MPKRLVTAVAVLALAANVCNAAGLKLVRYGPPGAERPGLVDATGKIRDLSAHLSDIEGDSLSPESLERIAALASDDLPLVDGNPRLGSPVSGVGKIIAVGFNYRDHVAETSAALPSEPVLFMKANTALSGPFDDILMPRGGVALDYEAELAIVIGSKAQYVDEANALDYVAGFAVGHDVSERVFQGARGGQFVKGKSADTFAPLGPWLVTTDGIADVQDLKIWSIVNGDKRQDSNTRYMIFSAAHIVSYVSQFMTLNPGDLIYTGTPAGVGAAQKPPAFLKPGDVVQIGIEGLGEQRQTVAPPRE